MSEVLTVEIPDDLAKQARAAASASQRRVEDAIVDWIRKAVAEPDVSAISDAQLIDLCRATLTPVQQDQLSELLNLQREGNMPEADAARLDEILAEYRRGMLLKAKALAEAARRGLHTGVSLNGA
jgi:hypothetical protein